MYPIRGFIDFRWKHLFQINYLKFDNLVEKTRFGNRPYHFYPSIRAISSSAPLTHLPMRRSPPAAVSRCPAPHPPACGRTLRRCSVPGPTSPGGTRRNRMHPADSRSVRPSVVFLGKPCSPSFSISSLATGDLFCILHEIYRISLKSTQ